MKLRILVPLLAMIAGALPSPAQEPVLDGLEFGRALGFEVGSPLERARANARARGEELVCAPVEMSRVPDQGACQPESWRTATGPLAPLGAIWAVLRDAPARPPYLLLLDGDTLDAVVLNLEHSPGLSRAEVERHWDRLGDRVVEGSAGHGLSGETIVWVQPRGLGHARLACRELEDETLCELAIGRAESPEALRRLVETSRRRNPNPLGSPAGG